VPKEDGGEQKRFSRVSSDAEGRQKEKERKKERQSARKSEGKERGEE